MDIKENPKHRSELSDSEACLCCISGFLIACILISTVLFLTMKPQSRDEPEIAIAFMNFTISEIAATSFSSRWNLLIRVPEHLPGDYICLNGDFQASLLYNNISIATSPTIRYKNLRPRWSHLLKVSGVVNGEDAIARSIIDDIKERSEVHFGLRLSLPDCRKHTIGMMKYVCDEVKLRYDSSPRSHEINTIVVGNLICRYVGH